METHVKDLIELMDDPARFAHLDKASYERQVNDLLIGS